jgi:hypothetical protein
MKYISNPIIIKNKGPVFNDVNIIVFQGLLKKRGKTCCELKHARLVQ